MDRALYQRLRELYHELGELSHAERSAEIERRQLDPDCERELLKLFRKADAAFSLRKGEDGDYARYLIERSAQPASELLPASIGSYQVEKVLGRGGMGIVYLASQKSPQRKVAIKMLRDLWGDERARRRFLREAEFLGRLRHRSIAQVIEAGRIEEPPRFDYIVLEYVEGVRVTEYVREHKLERDDCVRLLIDLCKAVHHAHVNGVIHRDLKPGNVLVTADGQLKVIDFGVARAVGGDAPETLLTEVGHVVGTLSYMSPEQIHGDPGAADARSDVYSIGVLAFELLSGALPRDLGSASLGEAVRLLTEVDAPALGKLAPECRGDLEAIVGKALERETDLRYQSAAELEADLSRFLSSEPILARPPSAVYQLRRFARRHKAVVAGVAATLLAILAGSTVAVRYAIKNHRLAALERDARELAEERLRALNLRSQELEQVADMQEAVLQNVDATTVGKHLVSDLHDEVERVAAEDIDTFLDRLDGTGLASRALERAILAPSLERIEQTFADQPRVRTRLLAALARNRWNLGLPALDAFERALELSRESFGPESVETYALEVQAGVSLLRRVKGDPRSLENPAQALLRAQDLIERGTAGLARLGLRRGVQASATLSLAELHELKGDQDRARQVLEAWLEPVLEGQEKIEDLVALRRLSKMVALQGDVPESVQLLHRVIEGMERHGAEDHAAYGFALTDLGTALSILEQHEESVRVLERAVAVNRAERGDLYHQTIKTLNTLGMAQANVGRWEAALESFEQAARSLRRTGDPRLRISVLGHLNVAQVELERFHGIVETTKEAVALVERFHGAKHPAQAPFLKDGMKAADQLSKAEPDGGWEVVHDDFRRQLESISER